MENKDSNNDSKRLDYEFNNKIIGEALANYLFDNGGKKIPTVKELAHLTGLSTPTINRHIKDIQFLPQSTAYRALTPYVLQNLFKQTHKSPTAVKLWLQVVEGWTETSDLKMPTVDVKVILPAAEKTNPLQGTNNKALPEPNEDV